MFGVFFICTEILYTIVEKFKREWPSIRAILSNPEGLVHQVTHIHAAAGKHLEDLHYLTFDHHHLQDLVDPLVFERLQAKRIFARKNLHDDFSDCLWQGFGLRADGAARLRSGGNLLTHEMASSCRR